MKDMIERIQKLFNNTMKGEIYFREREISLISDFLASEKSILHITGSSGTGKTCTVLKSLENKKFRYLNYFHERKVGSLLKEIVHCPRGNMVEVVVIDEFDKYHNGKKKESLKYLNILERMGVKVITISNDLKFGELKFLPYGREELRKIIKQKIASEVEEEVIEENALRFISLRFERSGDLRIVQKYIFEVLSKKEKLPIRLSDLIEKGEEVKEKNVQHEIIRKMVSKEIEGYSEYSKECEIRGIPKLTKLEFEMVYDIYKIR